MAVDIRVGNCVDVLAQMPDKSIHCCVTSPPYWGLRDYGIAPVEWPEVSFSPIAGLPQVTIPAQSSVLGLEPDPWAYFGHMVVVMREVRRVLRDDGTVWLNIGDSYNAFNGGAGPSSKLSKGAQTAARPKVPSGYGLQNRTLKPKDLMLMPSRLALALQADGWWIRSDIVWAKKSPMPESIKDRPTSAHEHVFLLAKSKKYFYDADAVREPYADSSVPRMQRGRSDNHKYADGGPGNQTLKTDLSAACSSPIGSNMRNVWHLGPEPFSEAHFATFPTEIPKRAILAGTSSHGVCRDCLSPWVRVTDRQRTRDGEPLHGSWHGGGSDHNVGRSGVGHWRDITVVETVGFAPTCACDAIKSPIPATVLDCFGGAGTTGLVADRFGRNAVLIEVNEKYAEMARHRIQSDAPMFTNVSTYRAISP